MRYRTVLPGNMCQALVDARPSQPLGLNGVRVRRKIPLQWRHDLDAKPFRAIPPPSRPFCPSLPGTAAWMTRGRFPAQLNGENTYLRFRALSARLEQLQLATVIGATALPLCTKISGAEPRDGSWAPSAELERSAAILLPHLGIASGGQWPRGVWTISLGMTWKGKSQQEGLHFHEEG